jgi:hypothetical protein
VDASTPIDASPPLDAPAPVDSFIPVDSPPPDLHSCPDTDGDGHASSACGGDDCDDTDRLRYPGAPERCQGVDDDCDGTIDEGSFPAFVIGAGSTTWRSYDLDCSSTAAPSAPIETVVDIESLSRAYFFTASTYHVLNLLTRTWVSSGARSTLLPETAGVTLVAGYTTPAGHAGSSTTIEGLLVASTTNVYVYEIDISAPALPVFRFATLSGGAVNPVAWTAPVGLQTAYQDVTGTWGVDPRPVCTTATAATGPYSVYFTADQALIDDAGWCFIRIAELPIASFGPFAYAGAPARSAWRHALYNAGVWVFGAPRF